MRPNFGVILHFLFLVVRMGVSCYPALERGPLRIATLWRSYRRRCSFQFGLALRIKTLCVKGTCVLHSFAR